MVTPWPWGNSKEQLRQGGLNALAAFLYGIVGQADHVEVLHAGGTNVDFDFNYIGIDTVHGGAERLKSIVGQVLKARGSINQSVTMSWG
jgi:hypothetical protein